MVVGEVSRVGVGGLAYGADYREGSVKHNGGFVRLVDILVGIADGQGAQHFVWQTSTDAKDDEREEDEEGDGVGEVIVQL